MYGQERMYAWREPSPHGSLITTQRRAEKQPSLASEPEEAMTALVAQHPEVTRVPRPLLKRVMQVFGSLHDRRSINGCQFLACFLRLAQIKQLALLPDQTPHEVAVVIVPGVRALCTRPAYSWPYCYETTIKYLALLCAAGIFLKPKQRRGMGVCYYFPLSCAGGLPTSPTMVQQLGQQRRKVRASQALQRVTQMVEAQEGKTREEGMRAEVSFHQPLPQRPSLPLSSSGSSEQEALAIAQQQGNTPGSMVSHEGSGQEMVDFPWHKKITEAVEDLTRMMQTFGLALPPLLKARMEAILVQQFHPAGMLPQHCSPSQDSQASEPLVEHSRARSIHVARSHAITSSPSPHQRSSRSTGFSSLQDLLAGEKAMLKRRDTQASSNEAKHFSFTQQPTNFGTLVDSSQTPPIAEKTSGFSRESTTFSERVDRSQKSTTFSNMVDPSHTSTVLTGIVDSSQKPTIATEMVDSSQKPTIATEMVDSSQKPTIPAPIADPSQESTFPAKVVDLSQRRLHDDAQCAYTHARTRVEFTHSLHSLFSLASETSEIGESEKEKMRASVVQKHSILGRKQVPSEQAFSQQSQQEIQASHFTSDPKQRDTAQAKDNLTCGQARDEQHLSPEQGQEDGSAHEKPSLSLMRQHLVEIRDILQALPPEIMRDLALDCSQRFSQSNEKTGVFLKRLYEHPEMLHLAAVDALVRTWFPDPGCQPDRLRAGWVLTRYRAYVEHREEPPEDIFAWARWIIEFGFNYEALERVLETAASQRSAEERGYVRPLPHQLVLDGMLLDEERRCAFWMEGGACVMDERGVLFIDVDGTLYTPQEYETHRLKIIEDTLAGHSGKRESATEKEIQAYLDWLQLPN